jgi:HSP20 family molecular chaperone IbpA
MYDDSPDVFAEMDELFDHLFSRMSGNYGMAGMGLPSPGTLVQEYAEEPEEPASAEVADSPFKEPVPEIFRDHDGTKIVVELPGVTEDNLNLALRRGELIIEAVDGECMYHTHAPVPAESDPLTMRHSLKNGVLEVTLCSRPDTAANAG